jgi:hypothetical protein
MSPVYLSKMQPALCIFTGGNPILASKVSVFENCISWAVPKWLKRHCRLTKPKICSTVPFFIHGTKSSDTNPLYRTRRNFCFSWSLIDAKDVIRPARASKLRWKSQLAHLIQCIKTMATYETVRKQERAENDRDKASCPAKLKEG